MTEETQAPKIRGMEVVISDEDRAAILEAFDTILRKGWLMWGDWQEKLQAHFATGTGRRHAVTFNSCTSALEVLFRYVALHPVCFQANAFPSPIFAARRSGLAVTWADIDPVALCPGVPELTKAYELAPFRVLVVQWTGGFIPDFVDEIVAFCKEKGIFLVEDASHSAGSMTLADKEPRGTQMVPGSMKGSRSAGSFGDASVFSLAATKPLQTGQGGILLTDSDELAEHAFQAKNYGRDEMFQRGTFVREGVNLHMTELQAAVGVILFRSMEASIARRHELAVRMLQPELPFARLGHWSGRPNLYKLPVILAGGIDKEALRLRMAARNIELGSSIYDFVTPHLEVFGPEFADVQVPQCEEFALLHVCLPLHNGMSDTDATRVAVELHEVLQSGSPA